MGKLANQSSEAALAPSKSADADAMAQKKNVLAMLDDAKFSWFHVKAILVAGMGFFCDSYDLFAISLLTKTIGRVYYPDERYYDRVGGQCNGLSEECGTLYKGPGTFVPGRIPANVDGALKGVALVGTLLGQLFFGYLGDRVGRKTAFGLTLWLMIIAAICQGLSFGSSPTAVVVTLCFWRCVLGFGVGGDYPLSATLMSEYSSRSSRGRYIAAVFAMQGTGYLVASAVAVAVAAMFQGHPESADYIWRIVLMFGAVPTAATMYWRLGLPETPRYTMFVEANSSQTAANVHALMVKKQAGDGSFDTAKSSSSDEKKTTDASSGTRSTAAQLDAASRDVLEKRVRYTFKAFLGRFWKPLLGCALSWFFLDVAFYSQNLFQSNVFSAAGWLPKAYTMDAVEEAYQVARCQAIIALLSTVPGYWMTVLTIEKFGRFWIQIGGFVAMTLFMTLLAFMYSDLRANHVTWFIVFYAATFFFANWGPNSTTFVVPAELFPTKFRSTAHGISAAAGKAGAIIGAFGFAAIVAAHSEESEGIMLATKVLALINLLGLASSFLVPETKGSSLEDLGQELALKADDPALVPMTVLRVDSFNGGHDSPANGAPASASGESVLQQRASAIIKRTDSPVVDMITRNDSPQSDHSAGIDMMIKREDSPITVGNRSDSPPDSPVISSRAPITAAI